MSVYSAKNYIPIAGFPIKIEKIKDVSQENESLPDIEGIGYIMTDWEDPKVWVSGKLFSSKVFICSSDDYVNYLLSKQVKDGDVIFATGDLSYRKSIRTYPTYSTMLWVEEFYVDPTNGKEKPNIAQLYSPNKDICNKVIDELFGDQCGTCGKQKIYVPERFERYCSQCESLEV